LRVAARAVGGFVQVVPVPEIGGFGCGSGGVGQDAEEGGPGVEEFVVGDGVERWRRLRCLDER